MPWASVGSPPRRCGGTPGAISLVSAPLLGAVPSGAVSSRFGQAFDEVLAAAQQGAGWACTRLYEALAPAVFGFLRSQGARDPADLTSEVFLAVFSRCSSFSGTESQFRSWVFTIAHHRLIDD